MDKKDKKKDKKKAKTTLKNCQGDERVRYIYPFFQEDTSIFVAKTGYIGKTQTTNQLCTSI